MTIGVLEVGMGKQKPRSREQREEHIVNTLTGVQVVVQARTGTIYEGEVVGYKDGFVILKNAVIKGKKHLAKTKALLVDRNIITHLHAVPTELKELEEG